MSTNNFLYWSTVNLSQVETICNYMAHPSCHGGTLDGAPVHTTHYIATLSLERRPYHCATDQKSNHGTEPVQDEHNVEKDILSETRENQKEEK